MMVFSREFVETVKNACREVYPNEFLALFREKNGVVSELIIPPNSIKGRGFATLDLWALPAGGGYTGSVHSHPGRSNRPSGNDLRVFGKVGKYHMVIGSPYEDGDISVYDVDGNEVEFEIR